MSAEPVRQVQDVQQVLRALPKVLLHDHLDGGMRPQTVVDLADELGHELPTRDPQALAAWFVQAAASGDLVRYLETFDHTTGVLQTADGLRRVAREAVVDLAADGVRYAEIRFGPVLHTERGLTGAQVVEAVLEGFAAGEAEAAAAGRTITARALVCGLRQTDDAAEVAELALTYRDSGVVGFDVAGPEAGFPATDHAAAFARLRAALLPVTVHAGEAAGPESVADAVQVGALRLGHGVRVAEDVAADGTCGRTASWVRDRGIPLEVCPSSNLQTGIAASVAEHPVTRLRDLGFAVTVHTDNRLQSGTSLSREMTLLVHEAGWTLADLAAATVTAAQHAFCAYDERTRLVEEVTAAWDAAVGRSTLT